MAHCQDEIDALSASQAITNQKESELCQAQAAEAAAQADLDLCESEH